jgi:hypothetical protein
MGSRARAGEGPVPERWRVVLKLYFPGQAGRGGDTTCQVATRIPEADTDR